MKNQVSGIVKGVAAGLAVGAAATMLGNYGMKNARHSTKKKVNSAMKSVGHFIDNMSTMMR